MKVYAKEQPSVDRKLDELNDEEKPIYEHFMEEAFVKKLINYLSLEENKGKDKFHSKYFVFFKVCVTYLFDTFTNFFHDFVHFPQTIVFDV